MDLVSRYSNPASPLLARVNRILAMAPEPSTSIKPRDAKAHKVEQRLRPEVLTELVADYEEGLPTTYLMVKYKLGKGTVLGVLRRSGVELRNQGLPADQLEAAKALYVAGWSLVKIGEQFKCDAETVRKELKLAGLRMRKPWERVAQAEGATG